MKIIFQIFNCKSIYNDYTYRLYHEYRASLIQEEFEIQTLYEAREIVGGFNRQATNQYGNWLAATILKIFKQL